MHIILPRVPVFQNKMKRFLLSLVSTFYLLVISAQLPAEVAAYYQPADGKKGAELKTALFQIISPHTVQSYTPGVWNAINSYDIREDGKIWEIYSAISNFTPVVDQDKGQECDEGVKYNREHALPKSWFNEDKSDKDYPMYTDLHHLFPTDRNVNEIRSNYPYGEVGEVSKQSKEGFSKLGTCVDSIGYTVANRPGVVFEPNDLYKGDLARAYFYMATCYEAYKNGFGKDRSLKDWSSPMLSGNVYPFFTDWALKMLLRWAANDPVSEKETNRNNAIFAIQKNRNPFVDYPGLEQYIWGNMTDVAFSSDNYQPVSTGISSPHKHIFHDTDDTLYNLQGQHVNAKSPRKGIYIRKGRKVIK